MAKKDKMMMPQGSAGLIRYFDSEKESVQLKPEHIVVICAAIIVFEILLHFRIFGG